MLFSSHGYEEGETPKPDNSSLFLRILISWGRITTFIALLEGCRHNWTAANIIECAQVMIAREDWDFLERLLDMSTTIDILKNSPKKARLEFHEVMSSLQETSGAEYIFQQY